MIIARGDYQLLRRLLRSTEPAHFTNQLMRVRCTPPYNQVYHHISVAPEKSRPNTIRIASNPTDDLALLSAAQAFLNNIFRKRFYLYQFTNGDKIIFPPEEHIKLLFQWLEPYYIILNINWCKPEQNAVQLLGF